MGTPYPFTREGDTPHPVDHLNAVIPVQRIHGPIFLACAAADAVWTSCAYGRAIIDHIDRAHDRFSHVLYTYAGAGHGLGEFIPYEPIVRSSLQGVLGGTVQADQRARAQDWPRLLDFLARFSRGT